MATLPHPAILRGRISIRGIVQGVGFRPFVYNLAQNTGIRGFVRNSSSGVTIEAEADAAAIEEFAQALRTQAIRELCSELICRSSARSVASKFHNTISAVIAEVCSCIKAPDQLDRICLSGGTFQNMYLVERSLAFLRRVGFEVFLHSQVPPNDGGISLGQAVVATQS